MLKRLAKSLFYRPGGAAASVGMSNLAVREAWLERTLKSIPAGQRILDAGAGEQQYRRFCEHLDYVSQDFAQYDGVGDGRARQRGKWQQTDLDIVSDITAIPAPDASFDAVMCIEVLEHVPQPVDALHELTRLLKPGGRLIVTAPFSSLTHMSPYYFQSGYSRYFYEHWLPRLGYSIADMNYNGSYFEWLAQEIHRLPQVARQYAAPGVTALERLTLLSVLRMLGRLSRRDNGSKELLCLGMQVLAVKSGR